MEKRDAIKIDASLGSGFAIVGLSIAAYIVQAASAIQKPSNAFWMGILVGGSFTFYGVFLLSRAARTWRKYRRNFDFR